MESDEAARDLQEAQDVARFKMERDQAQEDQARAVHLRARTDALCADLADEAQRLETLGGPRRLARAAEMRERIRLYELKPL